MPYRIHGERERDVNRFVLFVVDLDRCWGCRTCEVACAVEKSTLPRHSGISVIAQESERRGRPERVYVPVLCRHCDPAPCMRECPVDAIRRNSDGTVTVVEELCIACGNCEDACPYGAVTVDEGRGVAVSCDMCESRRSVGGNPSCVHHCIGGALSVIDEEEYAKLRQRTHTKRQGRLVYMSRKATLGG